MNITELNDYEIKALCRFNNSLTEKRWTKAGLVSLLKLVESELGLVSISEYAKAKGITTQGARKRNVISLGSRQMRSLTYS